MATINIEIVEGRGSLVASRNGTVVATINPGDGLVPVTYNINDTFYFQAYPDTSLGYSFDKFCGNTNCTITTVSNPFSGSVTSDGYLGVYFKGTPASINVVVQNNIGGKVEVYKNTKLVATVTSTQTVNFFINDVFMFKAIPSSGYSFSKYCSDINCLQYTSTVNPLSGTVTAASGNMYTFFTTGTACTSKSGEICLPGIGPVKTLYLIGVGAGIAALMLLKKK